MLKFMHTSESQTVKGKTVWNFAKAKVCTFGVEMGSFDEMGSLLRFFEKDDTIFKEETPKGVKLSFLHKDGNTMEKCMFMGKIGTGAHYIGIDDRKEPFKMMFTLSSSELRMMAEYMKQVIREHWDTDIGQEDTAKFDEKPQETKDNEWLPF